MLGNLSPEAPGPTLKFFDTGFSILVPGFARAIRLLVLKGHRLVCILQSSQKSRT